MVDSGECSTESRSSRVTALGLDFEPVSGGSVRVRELVRPVRGVGQETASTDRTQSDPYGKPI